MLLLIVLITCSFVSLQASSSKTDQICTIKPETDCLHVQPSDTTALPAPTRHNSLNPSREPITQEARDADRYQRYTLANIHALEKRFPPHLLDHIKDLLICKLLDNWDARLAYQHKAIKTSPQKIADLYIYLDPLYIDQLNADGIIEKRPVNPDDLAMMQPSKLNLVYPQANVTYLLNLAPERIMSFEDAKRLKISLDRATRSIKPSPITQPGRPKKYQRRSRSHTPARQEDTPPQPSAEPTH